MAELLIRENVRSDGWKWTTWLAVGAAHALHHVVAGKPMVVTSGNDGRHSGRVWCEQHREQRLAITREQFEARRAPCPACGQSCQLVRWSRHFDGDAFDYRVLHDHLTAEQRAAIRAALRTLLEPMGYRILSNDHENAAIARAHEDHEHIEYAPTAGRVAIRTRR